MAWYNDQVQRLFNLKTFPKIDEAVAYHELENCKLEKYGRPPISLFSREIAEDGSRYFLVENRSDFYDYYITMEREMKTFYEVLLSGRACRLFFDLEYDQVLNSDIEGEILMTKFRKVLIAHLKQLFAELCPGFVPTSSNNGIRTIIELDSSNEKNSANT